MVHLTLTARHLELTDALKTYVEEKVRRIERYTMKPVSAIVTLMVERYRHIVDISLNIHGAYVQAKGESNEMYGSIDKAVEKIERQMRKYKGKNQSKKVHFEDTAVQTMSERSNRDVSADHVLSILLEESAENTAAEKHAAPKTWTFGPIEPHC
jgi:ribosomal subunit interface protein